MTYVLYSTDAHNSKDSRCVLDFFSTPKKAVKFAEKDSKIVKEELTKEESQFLKKNFQTQGRKENYVIELNDKIQVKNGEE